MGLEASNTISGLNKSWPLGGDPKSQGDNHLRLIKSVLQSQFPNGFNIPVTASARELNFSQGVTSPIQGQFNTLSSRLDQVEGKTFVPFGTKMIFYQATIPVGWTLDISNNNRMLRVVNTTGGQVGGKHNPLIMDKVISHTHTGKTNFDGRHSHVIPMRHSLVADCGACAGVYTDEGNPGFQPSTKNDADHRHAYTTDANNNSQGNTWEPYYQDVIIGIKS